MFTVPVLLTSAAVIAALLVLRQLWVYYMDEPWTRDAHVGADVVQVAPDVSGLVETVNVADNQAVKKGDLLFVVDRARYRIALEQARAQGRIDSATAWAVLPGGKQILTRE